MVNPRSPLFREGEYASLHPSIYRILIVYCVAVSEQYVVELSGLLHTSGGISSSPAAFLFLIFLRTESSSSCGNGPSLMSNCLLIILVIGSCVIFGGFPSKFSKCCFHSFILSCWFAALSFCFGCVLSSAHFVYCLPGYSRLSIFHRVSNLIYLILNVFCLFLYIYGLLIDIVPFLVLRHLCLFGFFR